jgi:S1-C subfamily serine protease
VIEDSPAARAGLAQGDLIVAAAGLPIGTTDDLFDALKAAPAATIELSIVRGIDERVIQVTFGDTGQPDQEA